MAVEENRSLANGCRISKSVFQTLEKTYRFVEDKIDTDFHKNVSLVLSRPPAVSVLRINTWKVSTESAAEQLQSLLVSKYQDSDFDFRVESHPVIPDVLIVYTNYEQKEIIPHKKEVIVDKRCGGAILRGADVFVCGIVGASTGMVKGDCVSVHADIDGKCKKGLRSEYSGQKYFVGNGIATFSRNEIFQEIQPKGVAVKVTCQPFIHPSFHVLNPEIYFPQNLPSTLVGHNLRPVAGDIILDMCAAPGGKATHVGILMMNRGKVIAIDKSKSKVKKMEAISGQQQLSCIKCFVFDSTKLCHVDGGLPSYDEQPPYHPGSFDKIILDPPCSGIGQRPQLQCSLTSSELQSYPVYQRKLFEQAVKLLKPNGKLVYSTCTITIDENENQVAWALKTFKDLKLISQTFHIGGKGIPGNDLSVEHCDLVQRFDPCLVSISIKGNKKLAQEEDTIGFFIAMFMKI